MPHSRYQEMDRAEIDRHMNLRAACADHGKYFEHWARDSATARERLEAHLDLAYGDSEGETLDLFPDPARSAPTPLLAFIHGGYWQALDKGDFSYLAPPFVEAGIAFASINYDRRGQLIENTELLGKPFRKRDLARKVRAVLDGQAAQLSLNDAGQGRVFEQQFFR